MFAYRELSYGTWSNGGMGLIRMAVEDPKPVSKPPTPEPPVPTLTLVKKTPRYLYVKGDVLVFEDPPTPKRQKIAAEVEGRYRLVRGKSKAMETLYAFTLDGVPYMMTEAAIAAAMKRKPVIHTLPKPNASTAKTA